jgi:hypothetical protein
MHEPRWRQLLWAGMAGVWACGGSPAPAPAPEPFRPLTVAVAYPRLVPDSTGALVTGFTSNDSAFVFGAVSRTDAGHRQRTPVAVARPGRSWRNRCGDTVATFEVRAASMTRLGDIPRHFTPVATAIGVWIDIALAPLGDVWVRPGEGVRIVVRAAPGATLRLMPADSTPPVLLVPELTEEQRAWGELAFGTVAQLARTDRGVRYAGWAMAPVGPNPGPVLGSASIPATSDSGFAMLEAALGVDTVRAPWRLRLAVLRPVDRPVAVVNATPGTGTADGLAAAPTDLSWFLPNARAQVGRQKSGAAPAVARTVAWWMPGR